jgi:hypothetical protein
VSATKTKNSHIQVIIQKEKKNRIGVDLLCIIIELYLLNSSVQRHVKLHHPRPFILHSKTTIFQLDMLNDK